MEIYPKRWESWGLGNNGTKTHPKPIGILRATMSPMGVFDGTETELVIRHTLLNHPLDAPILVRIAERAQLASELRPREAGV